MKVFIVYAHPEAQSFNHAMLQTAKEALERNGDTVKISDLYAIRFNPVAGRSAYKSVKDPLVFKQQIEEQYATEHHTFADFVEKEIEKLEWCDLLIFQFPLNWFSLPAMLKGWADRTLAYSRCYDGKHLYQTGKFKGKKAMLSFTTGAPEIAYKKDGMNGDIYSIIRPIHRGLFGFVGFSVLKPQIVYAPAHIPDGDREKALADYAARLIHIGQEDLFDPGSY